MYRIPEALLGEDNVLFTPAEAAEMLRVSNDALKNWRRSGDGPKFVRTGGKVVYRKRSLLNWLERREFGSTSEERIQSESEPKDDRPERREP